MLPNDRRGNLLNMAVWGGCLVALVGLTMWKFDIWPIGLEPTPTGIAQPADDLGDSFSAPPIAVADAGSNQSPTDTVPAKSNQPDPLPPTELSALELDNAFPPAPAQRAAPSWPPAELAAEPSTVSQPPAELVRSAAALPTGPMPVGRQPATSTTPGGAFAESGEFPTAPPTKPQPRTADTPAPSTSMPLSDGVRQAAGSDEGGISFANSQADAPANAAPVLEARLAEIDAQIAAGKYLDAHRELSRIYWDEPQLRSTIQDRIDNTSKSIYFDPQPHYMSAYEVQPGDQLIALARPYGVPWEYLARLNRIDPQRMRAGQKLKVVKGPFAAVVDLSDFTLTVHAHGYYVRRYPVGIGQDGTTPVGTFAICLKESNPKYWGPNGLQMERDDPNNPLGERWLGLDDGTGQPTSYGIHGTIDPGSIGQAASAGCIRLRNEDILEVYDLLGVSSEVVIQR